MRSDTTAEHYRAKTTTADYSGYIKRGKAWLAEMSDDSLTGAFDVLSEKTPEALKGFLAYKCDHQVSE